MTELNAALFDFTNLEGVSEETAAKLSKDKSAATDIKARDYAKLVSVAGAPVSITLIIGAAERFFGAENVPTAASVRKYLNRAVELGLIQKPTSQTYAGMDVVVSEESKAELAADEAPEVEAEAEGDDALAMFDEG